jgi:hypothetical protein
MSRRLLLTGGIPVVGLIALFAVLALATRDLADVTIAYGGQQYNGGRIVPAGEAAAAGAQPTDERVGELQVWVPPAGAAAPPVVFLLRADGRFHRYEREP